MSQCFRTGFLAVVVSGMIGNDLPAMAQHLWWNLEGQHEANCIYGEITVLATQPTTYYCGANWHTGEPAGGYCGIQHNSPQERRTIFSIWDTSTNLHPQTIETAPGVFHNRFGGEGEGAHTHMIWNWRTNETFQFFATKQPGAVTNTTNARYYIFDPAEKAWRHLATINSPVGGHHSVETFGGGLNSFLENFSGQNKTAPRLAIYRLWLGKDAEHLKCLTRATGDGTWGKLNDCYFLASGGTNELAGTLANLETRYGKPAFGGKGKYSEPITDRTLPATLTVDLKKLTSDAGH
jgi:hypothetical protein